MANVANSAVIFWMCGVNEHVDIVVFCLFIVLVWSYLQRDYIHKLVQEEDLSKK